MGLQGKGRASVKLMGERLGGNKEQRVWESSVSVDGGSSMVENERV
jgi:hypothetical protein